jgi:pimeloyl-ACP methyl ester carboxylesterase
VLAHTVVDAGGARRTAVFLHGIYGRGRNWAAIARGLAARRPEWASALVDLRLHGASPPGDPPHTVAACAADVRDLIARAGWPAPAGIVVGHSFGGKVALSVVADGAAPPVSQMWIVDSTPAAGEPDGTAWRMLGLVRDLPQRVATRAEAIDGLTAGGITPDVAAWMASNLRREGDGLVWALDWDAMEALLRDFFVRDLWAVVEAPPPGVALHFIKATQSSRLSEDACARIEAAGLATGRVHLHRVEGGHWVHTDNAEAVTALLVDTLP